MSQYRATHVSKRSHGCSLTVAARLKHDLRLERGSAGIRVKTASGTTTYFPSTENAKRTFPGMPPHWP